MRYGVTIHTPESSRQYFFKSLEKFNEAFEIIKIKFNLALKHTKSIDGVTYSCWTSTTYTGVEANIVCPSV